MNFDGNAIRLSGFTPGSIVQLFTVDGQYVDSYRIGQDGSLIISLDGLKRGVHIVKTESITYKIIKK
jgi:phosphosulfolactate synthase (CoM biosynthesis protein A)